MLGHGCNVQGLGPWGSPQAKLSCHMDLPVLQTQMHCWQLCWDCEGHATSVPFQPLSGWSLETPSSHPPHPRRASVPPHLRKETTREFLNLE